MTTKKPNIVEDLVELREVLSTTYADLQTTVQSNDKNKEAAVKTTMAAFNLAMGAALQTLGKIAENPAIMIPKEEAIQALAKLNWLLLRIAPFLGSPNQNILVARSTGATVERLDFDERLRTKEHCGFLFHNVCNFLASRKQCLENGESTDKLDAILQAFCPPLMVYFGKNLESLDTLRKDEAETMESLITYRKPITMIRRFLLQSVKETLLLAWFDKAQSQITFAQRVEFTGLYVNKDLAAWAVSESAGLDPKFIDAGARIEMAGWTGLKEEDFPTENASVHVPHRIYQEGIPADIPTFKGEKVVLFYEGSIERRLSGKVFPVVELKAVKKDSPLSTAELEDLNKKIHSASPLEVRDALSNQLHRGADNDIINQAMLRLQVSDSNPVEALN